LDDDKVLKLTDAAVHYVSLMQCVMNN